MTLSKTNIILKLTDAESILMARTGKPKVDKPINRSVTVKFKEEYQIMIKYPEIHNIFCIRVNRA